MVRIGATKCTGQRPTKGKRRRANDDGQATMGKRRWASDDGQATMGKRRWARDDGRSRRRVDVFDDYKTFEGSHRVIPGPPSSCHINP
ncbi:hypothetical protein E5676_scaffold231G00080 [Cucumis melo var. makuwa]|uniref:Uncharacterized protein n=1 Tax=Cucumis melo var. makuwa TaxID=1194695 RepID=A0A5D3CKS1_CUCMM|nr:hypothetical protein E5676_scaffold231G00080 [Cucumis melo var. makuwa]